MRIDVSDWLGRHIFVMGEYEASTTVVIKTCLKRGDSFVDVGANAGYFTLLASKCVGSEGHVVSFEPLPSVRELLISNLQLNRLSNCEIFDLALSNRAEESEFFAGPVSHYGVSSLRCIDDSSGSIRVRTARMDGILRGDRKIDLVKIDVEGAECHVLEGMKQILQQNRPDIVLEVSPKYLEGMGKSTSDLDLILRSNGYKCYAIEHTGLRPLQSLSLYPAAQFNAFATARKSMPNGLKILADLNA